jgi:hypothetical protein
VTGYVPCYGRSGAITDNTQMTLFTAEGLRAPLRPGTGLTDGWPDRSSCITSALPA